MIRVEDIEVVCDMLRIARARLPDTTPEPPAPIDVTSLKLSPSEKRAAAVLALKKLGIKL